MSQYKKIAQLKEGTEQFGVTSFVQDRIVQQKYKPKKRGEGFIPSNELKTAAKRYAESRSDYVFKNQLKELEKPGKLEQTVHRTLIDEFGVKECQSKRFTRADVYPDRPCGLTNVALREGDMADGASSLHPQDSEVVEKLLDWWDAEEEISSI